MKGILNNEEFKEFEDRVKILSDKGMELDYTVKVSDSGNHQVILNGNYNLDELDLLTE